MYLTLRELLMAGSAGVWCSPHLDLVSKALLLGQLDLAPLGLELLVISMLAQAFQKVGLRDPLVGAKSLSDETGKLWVAVCQPATRGHTIGLVLEFFWCQIIEVLHASFVFQSLNLKPSIDLCTAWQLSPLVHAINLYIASSCSWHRQT